MVRRNLGCAVENVVQATRRILFSYRRRRRRRRRRRLVVLLAPPVSLVARVAQHTHKFKFSDICRMSRQVWIIIEIENGSNAPELSRM